MQKSAFDGVFDVVAQDYDADGVTFFKPIAKRLVEHADVKSGERVLDIGCGRGAVLFRAAEVVGESGEAIGIDIAGEMVKATAADAAAQGLDNVKVLEMDGQEPEFDPASFDAIVGSMSIIMVPDLPAALANYVTLLRSGGRFGMTSPGYTTPLAEVKLGRLEFGRIVAEIDPDAIEGNFMLQRLVAGELLPLDLFAEFMRMAGMEDVAVHQEPVEVVAESAEHLVRWTQNHGMKAVWDVVPADRRKVVEEELIAEVESEADSLGRVIAEFPAAYFVGNAPSAGV